MAINQDISNLPTPPSRSDSPSDFSDKADSFLGALPQLQTELNTYADEANSTQTAVNTSASNAATSEQNAAQSASDAEAFSDAAAAIVNAAAFEATTTYNINDAAIGSDGNTYRSLTDNNTGNDPVADDGSNWLQLTATTPDLVLTPENISPSDGATGALLTPELEGSSYGSLYGVPMASARWQINTTSTFPEPTTETKAITVATGTLYEGGGSTGNVFYVDGNENPALTLTRGSTYVFDQSDASNTGHPLRIQTTSDTQYTDGVTVEGTPGSAGAKTIFVVPLDAPTDLEYYCTVHGLGMGGPITTEALTDVEDTLVTGTATTYTTESLSPDSQFFWRVQYADTDGVTSDFSEATTFTTANIFTDQPTITEPADGATDIAEQPIIESSAFNTVNGSDTHVASQWVITRTSDGVDVFDSGEDTSNLESIQVPAGILDEGGENYTVKVRHKGSTYGFSAYSPDSGFSTSSVFFEFTPSFIGTATEGGFYAGNIVSDEDNQTYAIIVSDGDGDTDRTGAGSKEWRTSQTGLTEAQTLADGKSVMDHIVNNETLSDFPAFEWIQTTLNDANYNGYSDWYLPARDELELIYRHFKPTTEDNNDGTRDSSGFGGDGATYGTNNSSDPNGSGYTTSDPSQTSITNFQDGGADYLTDSDYWSSTEYDASNSWRQVFDNGTQFNYFKDNTSRVRAVRRIAV